MKGDDGLDEFGDPERRAPLFAKEPPGLESCGDIRRSGVKRLGTWLRKGKAIRADRLAETAVHAAERQHTSLPGEKVTAHMVHPPAREVTALNQHVAELDKAIEARFCEHQDFEAVTSVPGLDVILGAEFLAATGGDVAFGGTADRLAGFGGVAPVPRDSGKISGNFRRPRRYNRRLQRVFYISALFSIRHCDESRRFYENPGDPRENTTSRQSWPGPADA